ncbi:MAG: dTDP-glucose 4,6-dehydratase [Thermodesulfovibrionales bacterium]|nr:dTDP-glucose 4,6-dehydratase [Thermodesulfovibrionales bacterium]
MKKLLVTGGAGFIGSEFVRQGVRRGYEIVVVDKLTYAGDLRRIKEVEKEITFYQADITDKEFMEHIFVKEKPYAVIHWAAESHVDRSIGDAFPFLETNVRGTQILFEISKRYRIERFINISTDEVYGELKGEGNFYETSPLNPNSPYSATKASADMLGRAYFRTFGVPVITVRPSNTYGPFQYPEKLIPVAISRAMDNKPVPIYAKGENVREWLYVKDCVSGTYAMLEKGRIGEVYNIGSGQERKNIDVVRRILSILGKSESLIEFVKDRPGHDFRYSLNSEKIKNELSFEAETGFYEGLEKTVRWYVDNEWWWRRLL